MFKKYIVFSLGVILLLIPAQAYAVEEAEEDSSEPGTNGDIYYEPYIEPVEEEPYSEPWEEEPYVETWEEEPYTEPYIEPWPDDTYEEPDSYDGNQNENFNDQPVPYEEPEPYVAPHVEEPQPYVAPEIKMTPEPEPEPVEAAEPAELSISSVASETYNVSGAVTGDADVVEGVRLILSDGDETIETTSDEDGKFVFSDVPNGMYNLSAEESKNYEVTTKPIEVDVDDRNKLGYEITLEAVEIQPEPEEDLPIESAETDERSEKTKGTAISGFELSLIVIASILLLITISIVLFRKFSRRY